MDGAAEFGGRGQQREVVIAMPAAFDYEQTKARVAAMSDAELDAYVAAKQAEPGYAKQPLTMRTLDYAMKAIVEVMAGQRKELRREISDLRAEVILLRQRIDHKETAE